MTVIEPRAKVSPPKKTNRVRKPKPLTGAKCSSPRNSTVKKPIWEIAEQLGTEIPEEEWAKFPRDGSTNYSHYLYGHPKTRS